MAQGIQERLVSYLKDTHALEQMSLQMTQAAAKASKDPQMRELFQHHHEETQEHERLIRQRIEAHGQTVSKPKDLGGRFTAMAKGVGAMVGSDTPGRLARDGYVQEHTEVAAYELLCRVAERAGDTETAAVGRQILENERQTAEKIAASWDHAVDLSVGKSSVTA
jgi:ferritin-like metal-binding protein YciE